MFYNGKKVWSFFLISLFLTLCNNLLIAQTDTEFWFAPPEVTQGHGDRPIYLRISTLNEPALVNVTQPARNNLILASQNLPANTTVTINLTTQIQNLESHPPNQILQSGIRIRSSSAVSCYYEVGAANNSDIFALKGKNALGNYFIIPSQNRYNNGVRYNPMAYSSFDIVATENNTIVKITPKNDIVGRKAGETFIVKLNAGQTYSARNISQSATDNLGGSVVESNKPIAITLKEDSLQNLTCYDIIGDQLVPVKVTGEEYVLIKGFLETTEWIFITATEDNTDIFVNGSNTSLVTLQTGEMYSMQLIQTATYIKGSKAILVLQVTGFGCEIGMAIIPSINCKGSSQIGFTRSTDEFFGLNILVRKEGIQNFTLNGSAGLIGSNLFRPVPGTNDSWYVAQVSFSTAQVQVNQASLIQNQSHSFQIGIINGNARSSARFGYFSAFSTLFIGEDIKICDGQSRLLDAGAEKESYLWSTGQTTREINVDQPGTYWVKAIKDECILYDTIQILLDETLYDLGDTLEFCENEIAQIDAGAENFSYSWSDGSKNQILKTNQPGTYWIEIRNATGCIASDTFELITKPAPIIDLGEDIWKCQHDTVEIDAFFTGATYLWNTGDHDSRILATEEKEYHVIANLGGCIYKDSLKVMNHPGPQQDIIYGSASVCPGVELVDYFTEAIEGNSYQWWASGGNIVKYNNEKIQVNWHQANENAKISLLVNDALGCRGDTILYPVLVKIQLDPIRPVGTDTLCTVDITENRYFTSFTNGSVYTWSVTGGEIFSGQGANEVLINWNGPGLHSIKVTEESNTSQAFCSGISELLPVLVFQDSAKILMEYISVEKDTEKGIEIHLISENSHRFYNEQFDIYKAAGIQDGWTLLTSLPSNQTNFLDADALINEQAYHYYASAQNSCLEYLSTVNHTSILLSGEQEISTDRVSLWWNPYEGWEKGVFCYEIWRKLDEQSEYSLYTTVDKDQIEWESFAGADAFHHSYRIKAIQQDGQYSSWSNSVDFVFDHEIDLPNVFTPNGDGINDFFEIKKIELFPESSLSIFNRYGKKVYESLSYNNEWNGGNLSAGTYFYMLKVRRNHQVFKGYVDIIK
jgi:gliding motility-associated-like protein